MDTTDKIVNVICIILAWILSIVLVLTLFLAPVMLSALSLLKPQTITQVLADTVSQAITPREPVAEYQLTKLSAHTAVAQDSAVDAGMDILEELLGEQASAELLEEILSSRIVGTLIEAYTGDIADALAGSGKEAKFNGELLKKTVRENIDEITDVVRELNPQMSEQDLQELKDTVLSTLDEKAEEIVSALPQPEQIRKEIMQSNPELEIAFQILARKNAVKAVIIGIVVLLSGLVFVCRLRGFKGLRWVSADLFVGGGVNVLICAGLLMGSSLAGQTLEGEGAIASAVASLLSAFTTGVVIRTVVMLAAAIGILVGYILIKKSLAAKANTKEFTEVPNGV